MQKLIVSHDKMTRAATFIANMTETVAFQTSVHQSRMGNSSPNMQAYLNGTERHPRRAVRNRAAQDQRVRRQGLRGVAGHIHLKF